MPGILVSSMIGTETDSVVKGWYINLRHLTILKSLLLLNHIKTVITTLISSKPECCDSFHLAVGCFQSDVPPPLTLLKKKLECVFNGLLLLLIVKGRHYYSTYKVLSTTQSALRYKPQSSIHSHMVMHLFFHLTHTHSVLAAIGCSVSCPGALCRLQTEPATFPPNPHHIYVFAYFSLLFRPFSLLQPLLPFFSALLCL